ncbi:hypothetical protein FRC08_017990 [Ceratobasidium sp. 394]|nr:hypothetical protein FRC08_017990 [Ceratobasidium sp. 394]
MMHQSDIREIGEIEAVVNGVGSSRPESGKKRAREDDRSTSGGRRVNPFTSGGSGSPYTGMGKSLSPSVSTNYSRNNSLAYSTFPHRFNGRGALSPEENLANGSSVFEQGMSTRVGGTLPQRVGDSRPSNSSLSADIDRIMSGNDEVCLAEMFNSAGPPSPTHQVDAELSRSTTNERRSSSDDPINFISQPNQPSSRVIQPIVIDDDDADDDVVEEIVGPTHPAPGTPTGKTQFREGNVREKVREASSRSAAKQNAPTQAKLTSWAEMRGSISSAAKASETGHKPGPSTKGELITPGFTRPVNAVPPAAAKPAAAARSAATKHTARTSIAKNMKPKPNGGGLRIASRGAEAKNPLTSKGPSRKQHGNSSVPPPSDFEINIQEWHCGGTKHGAGKTGRDQHKFRCNSNNMVSLGPDRSELLTLMRHDFEGFEVAESSEPTPEEEAFFPALIFTVGQKSASSPPWQRFSGGDPTPRLMVKFDASDGIDERKWRQYVDHLAGFITKSTIKPKAMIELFKFQQAGANTPAQPNKKRPRPKPAKAHPTDDLDTIPPEVPPTMSGPSTRTRTRTAVVPPKDESQHTPPVQTPLQDPDEIMLVYPQSGTGAVNINRAELLRLEPGEFLNDTLIELGLKLWLNELRANHPGLVDQIHVFNSFFFKKLDAGGRGKRCDYNSVKKWTSKIDLFKKKFIIVPINEHLHWYLAIICFPEHVLRAPAPAPQPVQPTRKTRSSNSGVTKSDEPPASPESDMLNVEQNSVVDVDAGSPLEQGQMEVDNYLADRSQSMVLEDVEMAILPPEADTNVGPGPAASAATPPVLDMTGDDLASENQDNANAQKCWILIFDSLRGKHSRTVRILREYLQAEAEERHGKLVETKDSILSGGLVEDKHLPVPEQPNWCDCGVYLLHYVEEFVANPLELLTLPGLKRKASPEETARYDKLWQTGKVVEKREAFRDQVNKLSEEWRQSKSKGQDGPSITEEPTSDVRRASPLPNAGGELSVIEIDPPSTKTPTKEPATPTPARGPLRSGTLPLLPTDIGLSSPHNHELHPLPDQDQEVNIIDTPSPSNDTRASEDRSSISGHKRTRRSSKGGQRHTNPSWGKGPRASSLSPEL